MLSKTVQNVVLQIVGKLDTSEILSHRVINIYHHIVFVDLRGSIHYSLQFVATIYFHNVNVAPKGVMLFLNNN